MFKSAVIVPTCGLVKTLPFSSESMFNATGEDTLFVFSINPIDKEEAKLAVEELRKSAKITEIKRGIKVNFIEVWSEEAIGFCSAVNKGYRSLVEYVGGEDKLPETIIVCNDDVQVPQNWVEGLIGGLETQVVDFTSSLFGLGNSKQVDENFRVGVAVPVTNGASNSQKIEAEGKYQQLRGMKDINDINKFVGQFEENNTKVCTQHISGFCYAVRSELLVQLCKEEYSFGGFLDDKNFPIGGFDDNDFAVRVLECGWKMVIVKDLFVHHSHSSTLNPHFKEQELGLANRINYYKKYEAQTQAGKKVISAYRVAIKTVNDVMQLKSSIQKTATVLDGFSILLTNHPNVAFSSYDVQLFNQLPEDARVFLAKCQQLEYQELGEHLASWVYQNCVDTGDKNRVEKTDIIVEVWNGEFNEREERNRTHEMAEEIGADWIFSIDHDEVFEDRITREHIDKCVNHPNPQVLGFTVGWINHWESMSLFRTDRPYCDGYRSGMVGVRLWKVFKDKPQRIYAGTEIGLHCGNSPEYDTCNIKSSNIRFRHLSYVRRTDRSSKANFYNSIDKEKNEKLLGTKNYDHITKGENVQVSLYNPKNGVAFSMLCYEKENVQGIMNWMERMFSFADKSSLVWTGEWLDEDMAWVGTERAEWPSEENWYKTGPSYDLAYASSLFCFDFIHSKLTEDGGLAECRNAGIDFHLQQNSGLGWFLFMDPDELASNGFESALTRCTETTDHLGYLFRFKNLVKQGTYVDSSSVRLVRLIPQMKLSGRVHETFEKSINKIKDAGVNVSVPKFPVLFINRGLSSEPSLMRGKLKKYQNLLISELHSNPFASGSWLSLGLQFINDGYIEEYVTCLERACLTADTAYLPFRELGLYHLRESKKYFFNMAQRCERDKDLYGFAVKMIKFLEDNAPDQMIIETGADLSEGVELPPFPYDKISISPEGKVVIDEGES